MRLTLRTLLAYLDDTLEPLEIKAIGQKVAESTTAQELIARIKQVTRRRRITTPPATGPNSFEPNMVADYLDNELSAEQVAELEKICLESDVHLAEVASCHQILTLVLGEPAVVPPTAKERMYALVRGREAIPFRKAATGTHASAPTSEDADADEMFLLGLPFYRRGSWLRWALPIAAVLLFVVGGIALWQSVHGVQNSSTAKQVALTSSRNGEDSQNKEKTPVQADAKEDKKTTPSQSGTPNNSATQPAEGNQQKQVKPAEDNQRKENGTAIARADDQKGKSPDAGKLEQTPDKGTTTTPTGREAPPSQERKLIGKYRIPDFAPPSLLVQRKNEMDGWSRIQPGGDVFSNDELVSLPGYFSEVNLASGVRLLLRGHLREFTPQVLVKNESGRTHNQAGIMDYLRESAIVLHKPTNTDADLTLERGRLYLSNRKGNDAGAATVRLRFEKKVWDLSLDPGAEVVVDLIKARFEGEPLAVLKLILLEGNAGIAVERERYPDLSVPGWAHFDWNSARPDAYQRLRISKEDLAFAKNTLFPKKLEFDSEDAKAMKLALKAIVGQMTADKTPLSTLLSVLEKPGIERPHQHRLAILCLGAMDEVKELMNILQRADQVNPPDRTFAINALRNWLDWSREQEKRLFDPKTKRGLLVSDLGYTGTEANRIMELLRDPTFEQGFTSKEYYEDLARDLASDKVAIAELSHWRLSFIAMDILPLLKSFNAARPAAERKAAMQQVMDKISEGLLPPPTGPRKPGAGGGARPNSKGGSGGS